jgi:hypothetical protein
MTPGGDVLTSNGRSVDPCKVRVEYGGDRDVYVICCGACGDEWSITGYGNASIAAGRHLCAKLERNRLRGAIADLIEQTVNLYAVRRSIDLLTVQSALISVLDTNGLPMRNALMTDSDLNLNVTIGYPSSFVVDEHFIGKGNEG